MGVTPGRRTTTCPGWEIPPPFAFSLYAQGKPGILFFGICPKVTGSSWWGGANATAIWRSSTSLSDENRGVLGLGLPPAASDVKVKAINGCVGERMCYFLREKDTKRANGSFFLFFLSFPFGVSKGARRNLLLRISPFHVLTSSCVFVFLSLSLPQGGR